MLSLVCGSAVFCIHEILMILSLKPLLILVNFLTVFYVNQTNLHQLHMAE